VQRTDPSGCPGIVTQIARSAVHQPVQEGETPSAKLADLYARTGPGSVRLAYLLTGDRAVAEDIAQDAFIRVVGRLGHLRDAGAFDAYLRRAVVNLAKNHLRRRAVERRFVARATTPEPTPAPERQLVDRHAIGGALGRLSSRQRTAIVLRFYEDLSEDAIAQILRCRPATVRSLVARGVQSLRSELQETLDA
jgi:RNA polymerase sigma-70 factor (sigma-E family)